MASPRMDSSTHETMAGVGGALTGLGILIIALAPLAIPFLVLTVVFALPPGPARDPADRRRTRDLDGGSSVQEGKREAAASLAAPARAGVYQDAVPGSGLALGA